MNVVTAYSETIFEDVLGKNSGFTPREGSYALGLMNFTACCASIITLRYFGKRTLLIYGHLGMSLSWLLVAIFDVTGLNYGTLVMLCLFIFIY